MSRKTSQKRQVDTKYDKNGNPYRASTGQKLKKASTQAQKAKSSSSTHGNSNASQRPHHVYRIVDKQTGKTHKVGISGQKLNANGTSPRANRQVNAQNKKAGYEKYQGVVVKKNVQGRQAAKQVEQKMVDNYAKTHGGASPPGNILPRVSPSVRTAGGRLMGGGGVPVNGY